jgi:two-component system response regulator ChvI
VKSDLPVIFLTSKDEEIDEAVWPQDGRGRLHSEFSHRILIEHVKAVLRAQVSGWHRAEETVAAKVLERGQLRMDPERHACTWKNETIALTVTSSYSCKHSSRVPVWSRAAML